MVILSTKYETNGKSYSASLALALDFAFYYQSSHTLKSLSTVI